MAGRRRKRHNFADTCPARSRGRTLTDVAGPVPAPVAWGPRRTPMRDSRVPSFRIRRSPGSRAWKSVERVGGSKWPVAPTIRKSRGGITILIANECLGGKRAPKVHCGAGEDHPSETLARTRATPLRRRVRHSARRYRPRQWSRGLPWINLMALPTFIASSTSRHLQIGTCALR